MRLLVKVVMLLSLCWIYLGCSKKSDDKTHPLPNADQYITWRINGVKTDLLSPLDSLASARFGDATHIVGMANLNSNSFYAILKGDRKNGVFSSHYLEIYYEQRTYSAQLNAVKFTIDKYGDFGDYIIGSYAGNIIDSVYNSINVTGDFKIRTR